MKPPHAKLNDGAAKGQDRAAQHLPALTRAYGRALRAAGRRAARRFRQAEAVTAAAEPNAPPPGWVPPPTLSLIDQQDLADDTQRKTGRLHGRILTDATVPALDPFGIRFDIQAPSSQAILASYAQRIQATIQDAIAEQVTEAIQAGYAQGQSVAQVSRAIQAAVDGISGPRADMLARSDLNGLSNAGSLLAAKTTGAAATKTWLATEDEKTREWHADADGQTVPLADTFDVGGEAMAHPGDPNGSWENTANCRCTLVYGQPLTASAERQAEPSDFASWRDHAWEGASSADPVGDMLASFLAPSGNPMLDEQMERAKQALLAVGGPDVSNLAMVAVYPQPSEAEAIALPGGHAPEKMHVTLVFLGEADSFDHGEVRAALAQVAADTPHLSGTVGGVGRFATGPDGAPLIALPDVQGLSGLREAVADALAARGIESPSEHGWTPHLTLDYTQDGAMPPTDCLGSPLTFTTLSLAIADQRQDFALAAETLAAATPSGVLYLARHGLTEYDSDDHAKDTIRGWADDPLTDEGKLEAERLGDNLEGLGITSIQASDLQRAAGTAFIIGEMLDLPAFATDQLRPWNLGDFQGRTSDDARSDIAAYCDNPAEPVPGGESFNDFCTRFLPAVSAAMAQAEAGSSPLLVTHSHNLKLARAWVASGRAPVDGTAFMQPSPGPAAVLALTPADGGWTITEILCDGAPVDAAEGSVPPAVHYRPSDDPDRACGACEFFVASVGRCWMFQGDPIVQAAYVCDEFVAKSTLTSGGNMGSLAMEKFGDDGLLVRASPEWIAAFVAENTNSFAASGDTTLPLSERDRAWDAGEATARVKKWASSDGSGDPDKIDYGKLAKAYFWKDAPGSAIGDFKLPFADVLSGKLTAVWRGVTAAAGRLNQTQGVNEAAVKKAIAGYYAKAAKQYSDPTIKVPWAKSGASANGETLAAIRASLADQGADGVLGDDELRAVILAVQAASDLTAAAPLIFQDFDLTAATAGGTQWQATLCVAGEPTVDSGIKRVLDPDGGSWLPLPRPLALLDDSPHAEVTTKAPICGRIDQIWWAGNVCQASGVFFDDSDDVKLAEAGSKACALVSEFRGQLGISVDLVDTEVEMCAWGDSGPIEMDSANDPTARNYDDAVDPNAPGGPATEANLPNDIPEMEEEVGEEPQYVLRFLQWVIAGATICPVQALTQATIGLVAGGFGSANTYRWWGGEFHAPALTASAAGLAPVHPPRAWFEMEEAAEPTPITVEDDGRVYGHIALWDSCHTGFPGRCVPPPKSASEYAGFHLGAIKLADGDRLPVGTLTMDTGHASHGLSAQGAVAHYDHTGTQAAFVRASDGQHGIWVCGTLSPRLDAADAQALMAAKPSGDWREVFRGRGRDMIGALAVNVPGFPVPRTLVASGLLAEGDASVEFWSECEPCEAELGRELAVLAASVDGVAGLAALVEV